MPLYELINPSDTVTFYADSDEIASLVVLLLGRGNFDASNEKDESLGLFAIFMNEEQSNRLFQEKVGCSLDGFSEYLERNHEKVTSCLKSFAYVSRRYRELYDSKINSLEGKELEAFRNKWEDENRSSMNKIVQAAWNWADKLEGKNHAEQAT